VIKQLDIALDFQPIADTQAIYRLIDSKLTSSPAKAFHTKKTAAAGLPFLDAGIATLIPSVPGVAFGGVRSFHPAAPPFVSELNYGNRAQSIRDRERCIFRFFRALVLGERVAPRPSATRAKGVERGEPRELREGHIRLAVFPGGAGLVCKVAEETTVRGEIGPPWKDASTEPSAGFVAPLC